jgi:hypothetical protein
LTVPLFLSLWFPWPFGPERVNLYLVSPIALTILLGWEFALTNRRTTPLRVAFALVFVGLQMPSDLSAYCEKYGRFGNAQEELVPALQAVVDIEGSQSALPSAGCIVFSNMSSYAVRYYSTFHVRTAPRLKAFLAERPHAFVPSREPEQVQASIRRALTSCPRVWIVLSHYNDEEIEAARRLSREPEVDILYEHDFIGATVLGVRQRPPWPKGE